MKHSRTHGSHHGRASPLWLVASAAVVAGVFVGWLFWPDGGRSAMPDKNSVPAASQSYLVKWNGPITPTAAGVIVAQADGLFSREGLTVTLQAGNGDADVVAAVAADRQIVGHVSAWGFLRARASGLPVVAFAGSYMTSPVELYALATTSLNAPADLAGKTLSYAPDSENGTMIEALIRKHQIPRSQIKLVEAPASVPQLLAGRIDVLVGRSEIEGEELRASKVPFRILNPAAFGIHSVGTVYIVSEQAIVRDPDVTARFLAALIAGWDAAYANYDRTIPIIAGAIDRGARIAGVADLMDRQRSYIRPFGARMGELDFARWRELQDRLLAQRLIAQPVDLRQAVMFSLVPELYRTRLKTLSTNQEGLR